MLSRAKQYVERKGGQASWAGTSLSEPGHIHFDGSFGGMSESQTSVPSFFSFLPCKDNQVYVKYVCSFDSPRYLINSITPNTIVPKVFEMRIGMEAFLILSINVNIFLAVAMARARVHENTE